MSGASVALFSALATSFTLTLTTTTGGRTHLGGWSSRRGGAVTMAGWTGSTSASVDVPAVPVDVLYNGYADLSRMTEWSPLLDSVTVDPDEPSHSVWVMRVPSALQAAADMLGYPAVTLSWEADLVAPGPPYMNWTSTLDEDGKLKGLPNAGFEPSGAVVVEEVSPDLSRITLTLKYAMPDGVPSWQIALVRSPPVQFVLRSRIKAGLKRFSTTMQREWSTGMTKGATTELDREAVGRRFVVAGRPTVRGGIALVAHCRS